jgi:hypothetical protein
MTTQTMRRQIDRAKRDLATVMPKPRLNVRYTLLAKPPADASDEVHQAHQVDLDAAQASGGKVIYLVGIKPNPKDQP